MLSCGVRDCPFIVGGELLTGCGGSSDAARFCVALIGQTLSVGLHLTRVVHVVNSHHHPGM